MDFKIQRFQKFSDSRGDLIVFLKDSQLTEAKKRFGQIYFVTFKKKGAVRGNHYHKKWHEWFGIVTGRLQVILEDVKTRERKKFVLDARKDQYVRLEVGPFIAHAFRSLTKYAALLNYADSEWYSKDSIYYKLI